MKNVILLKEREKERKKIREKDKVVGRRRKSKKGKKKKVSLVNGFHDFQLIYKKTTPLLEN